MRVYSTELICSTGVLGFHTFKLALCIYNKLRSHAEILRWWAFDVTFPGSNPLRSNWSGLNVINGGSWNPKFTLKVNSFWIKILGQKFASQVLSRHTFKISREKGSDFFYHRGTLIKRYNFAYIWTFRSAILKRKLAPCSSYGLLVVVHNWWKTTLEVTFYDTGSVNRRKSVLSLGSFTRD